MLRVVRLLIVGVLTLMVLAPVVLALSKRSTGARLPLPKQYFDKAPLISLEPGKPFQGLSGEGGLPREYAVQVWYSNMLGEGTPAFSSAQKLYTHFGAQASFFGIPFFPCPAEDILIHPEYYMLGFKPELAPDFKSKELSAGLASGYLLLQVVLRQEIELDGSRQMTMRKVPELEDSFLKSSDDIEDWIAKNRALFAAKSGENFDTAQGMVLVLWLFGPLLLVLIVGEQILMHLAAHFRKIKQPA